MIGGNLKNIRKALAVFVAVFFCGLLVPAASLADEVIEKKQGIPPEYFVKLSLGLAAIILMILLLLFGYRKFGGFEVNRKNHLFVESSLSLGHKEKIVLVKAGKSRLLLGVTANNISKLQEIKNELDHENPVKIQSSQT